MAENDVNVTATIRLKSDQLKSDADSAKKVFEEVRKEVEKPAAVAVETAPAEGKAEEVKRVFKEVKEEIETPAEAEINIDEADKKIADLRAHMRQAKADLESLKQSQGGSTTAKTGGEKSKNASQQLQSFGKALVGLEVALASVEAAFSAVDIVQGSFNGNLEQTQKGVKGVENAIKGLPVIGDKIVSIGAKINELFTGDMAYADRVTAEAEAIDKKTAALTRQANTVGGLREDIVGIGDEARQDVREERMTPDQREVEGVNLKIRETLRKQVEAQKAGSGKGVEETTDTLKALYEQRFEIIDRITREHELEAADIEQQAAEARLRAQGKNREAERAALVRELNKRIQAEKNTVEAAALGNLKDAELAEFDVETARKAAEEKTKAEEKSQREQESAAKKAEQEKAREAEKAEKEKRLSAERTARLNEEVQESTLRAAGKEYEADVVKFTAASDRKIRTATTEGEKRAAIAAKTAGLVELAYENAKKGNRGAVESRGVELGRKYDLPGFSDRDNERRNARLERDADRRANRLARDDDRRTNRIGRDADRQAVRTGDTPRATTDIAAKQLAALDKIVDNTDPAKRDTVEVITD